MRLKQAPYAIRDVVSPIRFAHYTPLYAFRKRDYLTLFILWRHYLKVVPYVFKKNGISSLSGKLENGELLDNKKIDNLFSENQSDTPLLVILPIKAKVYCTSYCVTEFSVKTSLHEVKQGNLGKQLWNATIDLPTPFRVFPSLDNSVAEKLANTVLERMKADGLIK